MGQTGYSQPIPKAGIGGSPRFAARTPIGITSDKGSTFLPGAAAEPTSSTLSRNRIRVKNPRVSGDFAQPDIINDVGVAGDGGAWNGPSRAPSEPIQPCPRIPRRRLKESAMQLRTGYELIYSFPQPTPIVLLVNIHDSRASDIVVPDRLTAEPSIPITGYRDAFGNRCHRVLAPAGRLRLAADGVIRDSGQPDENVSAAGQELRAGSARRYPRVPVGQPLL